jgi:hypothetical protein
MRVAYFTAGTVGAGHLTRGVAIGRALRRAGVAADYRMLGPALPFPVAATLPYEVVPFTEAEVRSPVQIRLGALARTLTAFAPDVLIVDLYWAPLHHLLPLPGCETWLLVRSCPPAWFGGPPDTRWDPRRFARVVGIEPVAHAAVREHVAPVVVCNPDELRTPGSLRAHLGVAAGERLTVVAHAGAPGEIDALAQQAGPGVVRCDLFDDAALFPLAEWLRDADAVVAGGGYNTFWESRWLGWRDHTTFVPFARQIDDQRWRVTACADVPMTANGADVLAGWLRAG